MLVAITDPNGSDGVWEGPLIRHIAAPAVLSVLSPFGYTTGFALPESLRSCRQPEETASIEARPCSSFMCTFLSLGTQKFQELFHCGFLCFLLSAGDPIPKLLTRHFWHPTHSFGFHPTHLASFHSWPRSFLRCSWNSYSARRLESTCFGLSRAVLLSSCMRSSLQTQMLCSVSPAFTSFWWLWPKTWTGNQQFVGLSSSIKLSDPLKNNDNPMGQIAVTSRDVKEG